MAKKPAAPLTPLRPPDHVSKRGVPYWWAPEWCRQTGTDSYGLIKAIKEKNGAVNLYMVNKTNGNLSYIQGSIQEEFREWHEDRKIDYILLGEDPDQIIL